MKYRYAFPGVLDKNLNEEEQAKQDIAKGIREGVLGDCKLTSHDGQKARKINDLVRNAGGSAAILQRIRAITQTEKDSPEMLCLAIGRAFKLSAPEYSAFHATYWLVSGAPAVEMETSLCGGLHDHKGVHMRGWRVFWDLIQCKGLPKHGVTKLMAYWLGIIALVSCGPPMMLRVCQEARKMVWANGFAPVLQALWGNSILDPLLRMLNGNDCSNLFLESNGLNSTRYSVRKNVLGSNEKPTVCPKTTHSKAVQFVIDKELQRRKDYRSLMTQSSKHHIENGVELFQRPETVFTANKCPDTSARMKKMEELQRTNDPNAKGGRKSRSENAEDQTHASGDTPLGNGIQQRRGFSRDFKLRAGLAPRPAAAGSARPTTVAGRAALKASKAKKTKLAVKTKVIAKRRR